MWPCIYAHCAYFDVNRLKTLDRKIVCVLPLSLVLHRLHAIYAVEHEVPPLHISGTPAVSNSYRRTLWDLRTVNSSARIGVVMAVLLVIALGYDIHENPQHLRNQFTYKYDREWPDEELLPLAGVIDTTQRTHRGHQTSVVVQRLLRAYAGLIA